MAYKTAIFDLDGTLLDTLTDIAKSVNYALEINGFEPYETNAIKALLGSGIRYMISNTLPKDTDTDVVTKVLYDYIAYYEIHMNDITKPYDGILELLDELKKRNIQVTILSNKPDAATKALAKEIFGTTVCYARGQVDGVPAKPYPNGVFHILEVLGEQPENCIFIGDSDVDIRTGKNSNIFTVGVSWGFRSVDELVENGADLIVYTPDEILKLF